MQKIINIILLLEDITNSFFFYKKNKFKKSWEKIGQGYVLGSLFVTTKIDFYWFLSNNVF